MKTRFQLQQSTCLRADCNASVSSRQAFTRTLSVLQASRPHLEEVNLLPGAAAPGNSPGNLRIPQNTHLYTANLCNVNSAKYFTHYAIPQSINTLYVAYYANCNDCPIWAEED